MLKKENVKTAVGALMSLLEEKDKDVLLDHPDGIFVQFTLKHIQPDKNQKIHINLPHSQHYDTREVCLFVKDLDHNDIKKDREYEKTVQFYEDLFKEKKVNNITKVIPMKALRTDYSMFSDKRNLSKAYDLYLADECVMGFLPGLLGKIFYSKSKTRPLAVNLTLKDLDKEINRVVDNAFVLLQGKGSSSTVCIGHSRMTRESLVDNISAAFETISEKIPGGKENLKNAYIKAPSSMAIPLYINLDSPNAINLPAVKQDELLEFVDEVSTVEDAKIKVRADGKLKIMKSNKKHEADDVTGDDSDDISQGNVEEIKETSRKTVNKGKAGNKRKAKDTEKDDAVEKKKMRESLSEGDDDALKSDEKPSTPKTDGQANKKRKGKNKKNKTSEENVSKVEVEQKSNDKQSVPKTVGQANKKGKQNKKVENSDESVSKGNDAKKSNEQPTTQENGGKAKKNRKRKGNSADKADETVGDKKMKENVKKEPKLANKSENVQKSDVNNKSAKSGKQPKVDKKPLVSKQNDSNGSPAANKKAKQTGGGKKNRSKKA
ncbi:proteasome-interacting protein cic1 [Mactra antiquata]